MFRFDLDSGFDPGRYNIGSQTHIPIFFIADSTLQWAMLRYCIPTNHIFGLEIATKNLLIWLQNNILAFHFEVEQQVNKILLNFLGFNAIIGACRIMELQNFRVWLEKTTVEVMDIAIRAHLYGWKFFFFNDDECQCELLESYEVDRNYNIDGVLVLCSCSHINCFSG